MIVVIADDLSGAAELAGAALNHGLAAEVQTRIAPETNADVICLDTDTRSMSSEKAAAIVAGFARKIAAHNPEWIYKKCDSVLRGNVLAEVRGIIESTNCKNAMLISANPTRGRIIRDGKYFIDGQPLHQTPFANDPEHPRRTSRVAELLGGTKLSEIRAPDAESTGDLDQHARALGPLTLPAGGMEFFEALLRAREMRVHPQPNIAAARSAAVLFVCGSAAAWANGREAQAELHEVQVERMPEDLVSAKLDPRASDHWSQHLAATLQSAHHVMAAIARTAIVPDLPPSQLAERLACAVAGAIRRMKVGAVCVEGGATAAAVARAMSWTRFRVARQIAGGVVEMQPMLPDAPVFIIKVGSYDWPEEIWPNTQ